jgi:hypothetical protein
MKLVRRAVRSASDPKLTWTETNPEDCRSALVASVFWI